MQKGFKIMKDKRKGKKEEEKEEEICEMAFQKTLEFHTEKDRERLLLQNVVEREIERRTEIRKVRMQGDSYVITIPSHMLVHLGFNRKKIKRKKKDIGYIRLIKEGGNRILLEKV